MENLWLPIRKIITNEYKKTWPVIGIYWQYLLGIHDMVFGLWSYETSRSDSLFGGLDLQFGQSHGGLHPLDRSRRRVWIEAEAKPQCWRSVDTWAVARHLIYSDILSGIISGIPSGIYSDIISGTRGWSPVVPPASIYIYMAYLFWHSFWHSIWHLFWHSFWHPRLRCSAPWDLAPAASGSTIWLWQFRQRPLRSGTRSWDHAKLVGVRIPRKYP